VSKPHTGRAIDTIIILNSKDTTTFGLNTSLGEDEE
jgi:hypothetical protein